AMMAIAFTSLLFSDFIPNQDLGLITIITIVCAVLVDLILLPIILLKVFDDHRAPKKESDNVLESELST
ncbi:MAG: hypothetical protein MI808_12950, partial [Pseudomonadales bacterium]|nr:hypothetical protein [Pseudomonadales bacterium]